MARVYATEADVRTFTGDPSLTVTDAELRRASLKVDRLTRNAVYDTDAAGLPTDEAVADALRDATCAQVEWFQETGTASGATGALASMALGSANFTFRGTGDAVADADAARTSTEAVDILRTAGLMNPRVRTR